MDFFQSPSMLCTTGWVPDHAKMAAETAVFSVAEIRNLKLNVLGSYLPNIYFQLGRQALEVIFYEQKGRVLTFYCVSILCKQIHVHLFLFCNSQFLKKQMHMDLLVFNQFFQLFYLFSESIFHFSSFKIYFNWKNSTDFLYCP